MEVELCEAHKAFLSDRSTKKLVGRWQKQSHVSTIAPITTSSDKERLAGKLSFTPAPIELWWDSACSFHPIVLQTPSPPHWRMYYYGRDSPSWRSGVTPALLSSGRIGMASSSDGLNWSRTLGPLPEGAIMDPREGDASAFDSVHVGCSDVFFHDGMWWMYYFGGGLESMRLLVDGGRDVTGMRLRTGLARSCRDDGIHGFDEMRERDPVLDVGTSSGEWDEMMVAWARVMPPSATPPSMHWLMTYTSMCVSPTSTPAFCIGTALSEDGRTWSKAGKVLGSGELGSWDDGGVSRRHVISFEGQLLMFYEGTNKGGVHAIGLATSEDGITWTKDKQRHEGEPGGPVFSARLGSPEAWDNGSVSCPHVVKVGDGGLWLYYVGFDATKKVSAFGVACSDGKNFRSFRRMRIASADGA